MVKISKHQIPKSLLKLEAIMDWFGEPSKRKHLDIACVLTLIGLLLWGVFMVPSTILQDSPEAKQLVSRTVSAFPWIDNLHSLFGFHVEKFIYLQCLYSWILPIPWLLMTFSLFTLRVGQQGINIDMLYRVIFKTVLLPIAGILFSVLSNNLGPTLGRPSRSDNFYLLNEYTSAIGALINANLLVISLLILLFGLFYLFVIFRNIDVIIKEYLQNLNRKL
jgi:hypothetical protein